MPPKPKPPRPKGPQPRKGQTTRPNTRLLFVLGAGVLVGVVAVVLSVALGGNKSKTPTNIRADLSAVGGIPQRGLVLGNPKAKIRLTEYVDVTCPICENYMLTTFPKVSQHYVRTGKITIELRPVNNGWPSGGRGRALVLAAAEQNKAFQYDSLLYQNQGGETQAWLTDGLARAIAAKIPGLDAKKLFADASSPAVAAEAAKADAEASTDGVRGTPTFVLTTKDGTRHLLGSGSPGFAAFQKALDHALAQ
ncbi:MAG TPA: thioredoxin domain-containing protein [Gaiellaceae bacterium]|nr:thioredoxin domain-containing protein [Gaiellaceae bacterium]